uniref:G patch domain-containing protein 11 n=1 Tax=Steinernema glaseri TaxID=37863 RepID=A0A1I7Y0H5_9BILA
MASESESEEDYMSETFLASLDDVKPGVSATREQRRQLKLQEKREEIRVNKPPKKAELEKAKRDEVLAKPISAESKGFALLAKMGYKPGMKLGVQKEGQSNGLEEPLSIDLKANRAGLGHEAEEEKQKKERVEAHMKHMKARAAMHNVLVGDFRKRKRNQDEQKILIADIMKSRKACHELDTRNERELPVEDWHWPIYRERKATEEPVPASARVPPRRNVPFSDDEDDHELHGEDDEEVSYVYANGKPAPREERLRDLPLDEIDDKLQRITKHLRDTHLYCVWCGHQYESEFELSDQCPGTTRGDHE